MKTVIITLLSSLFFICNAKAQKIDSTTKNDTLPAETAQIVESSSSDIPVISNDYTKQLEQAIAKQSKLKKRKKELQIELKEAMDKEKKLSKQFKKLRSKVSQYQNSIQESLEMQKSTGYVELCEKKEQLLDSIEKRQLALNSLNKQLTTLDEQLEESSDKMSELNKVKQEVCSRLIAENEQYIGQPFSQQTIVQLKEIRKKCSPYISDQKIHSFVEKIDNTINNRIRYDEIQTVLNSKYNKAAISLSLTQINSMKDLSINQKGELGTMKKQLESFADGLSVFKEFINNLNKCRDGVDYSIVYFQDDKKRILPKDLEQRLNTKLLIVPYLKAKYEDFMNAFEKDPNKHSDIEMEILNQ